jgi:hypothetical protein
MKILSLSAVLILISVYASSQNLVGYKEKAIRKYMKENRHDMNFNNVVNSQFRYLKYSDNSDSQTLLFFLDPDSTCKSVKIICDVSMKSEKVNELNSHYSGNGENKWVDRRDGKDYLIELKEGKWSCVISIERRK